MGDLSIKYMVMEKKFPLSWFFEAKSRRQKFAAVSCYDYTSARLAAKCPVEMLLVGDSAAEFMLGLDSTRQVRPDYMLEITAAVSKAAPELLIVSDMPYLAAAAGRDEIIRCAKKFISESSADIVKIEAAADDIATVKALVDSPVPVMAHLGIRPQSGNLRAQAATAESAVDIISLAEQMVKAGSSMLLLEGTAAEVAEIITKRSSVPVISCGSGPGCDGQILVLPDILGLIEEGTKPKFSKSFAQVGAACTRAITSYAQQVKNGEFPDPGHCYHMKQGQAEELNRILKGTSKNLG